jgi:hypothetical protein
MRAIFLVVFIFSTAVLLPGIKDEFRMNAARSSGEYDPQYDVIKELRLSGRWQDLEGKLFDVNQSERAHDDKYEFIGVSNKIAFDNVARLIDQSDNDCETLLSSTGFADPRLYGYVNRAACNELRQLVGFPAMALLMSISVLAFRRVFGRFSLSAALNRRTEEVVE